MEQVAILVPYYRDCFSAMEKIAWEQLCRILGSYPIYLVAPERLRDVHPDSMPCKVEYYPDFYFESISSYSRLLLEPEFYVRFSSYEYILIHQLDAFVFSDRLAYFCSLGYDYIGAPLSRWSTYWRDIGAQVGNGGFSLRKVEAMLRVLRDREAILYNHPLAGAFLQYEDLFFGYCGKIGRLKVPDITTALKFAIEDDVRHCYKNFERNLPFGCHGWYREKYAVCKPAMEQYDYDLPETNPNFDPNFNRKQPVYTYLMRRLMRLENQETAIRIMKIILPHENYAIWGGGQEGKWLCALLRFAQVRISVIFERNVSCDSIFQGIPITLPVINRLRPYKRRLLLGSDRYERDMIEYLKGSAGFQHGEWLSLHCLKDDIVSHYTRLLCGESQLRRNVEVVS